MDVWLISLERERESVLSADEETRAARFHFEHDRIHWARSRSALRMILSQATGIAAGEIRFTVGHQGKPSIPDHRVEFSLSHAGVWAMVAVTHDVPVGVDIERMREDIELTPLLKRLGETNLPESRDALYGRWTQREAKSKAVGGSLFDRLRAEFRVRSLEAPEGYSAAVALIGDPGTPLQYRIQHF